MVFFHISGALLEDFLKCTLMNDVTPECIAANNSAIMTKYDDCLDGHLTEEEKIWSDNIVTTWTNFAING